MRILALAFFLASCGGTAARDERPAHADGASDGRAVVSPDDPSLEIDPQICAVDADCMIGTPRNCCASFCPEDRQAWSVTRWREYQDDCAVVECAEMESAACQDRAPPPLVAVCRSERCVLETPR